MSQDGRKEAREALKAWGRRVGCQVVPEIESVNNGYVDYAWLLGSRWLVARYSIPQEVLWVWIQVPDRVGTTVFDGRWYFPANTQEEIAFARTLGSLRHEGG